MGRTKWGLVCALSVCLFAVRLVGQEGGDITTDMPANAEGRIEQQLNQRLNAALDFREVPLSHLMEVLAEEYGIPIQFDRPALDAVAQSPETEVSISVHGEISLQSALNLILANVEDLTYIVDDEVLLITTEDEAETRLEVRIYRVDDLRPRSIDEPQRGGGSARAAYDFLQGIITDCVEPESWTESGNGEGQIRYLKPGMYVVLQTRRVHQQIEKLLAEIRACKAAIESEQAEDEQGDHGEPAEADRDPFAGR